MKAQILTNTKLSETMSNVVTREIEIDNSFFKISPAYPNDNNPVFFNIKKIEIVNHGDFLNEVFANLEDGEELESVTAGMLAKSQDDVIFDGGSFGSIKGIDVHIRVNKK